MSSIRSVVLVVASLVLAVSLYGCGGCQEAEDTPAPRASQPQAEPKEPQAGQAPPQPQAGKPSIPAQPPAAAVEEPEVDCFVIVDAEPDFGSPPLKVQFETEVDCTAEPVVYSWDFGDGTKGGNEANPTHVYEKPGDYLAVVTTKSADGGEGEDEIDITVETE